MEGSGDGRLPWRLTGGDCCKRVVDGFGFIGPLRAKYDLAGRADQEGTVGPGAERAVERPIDIVHRHFERQMMMVLEVHCMAPLLVECLWLRDRVTRMGLAHIDHHKAHAFAVDRMQALQARCRALGDGAGARPEHQQHGLAHGSQVGAAEGTAVDGCQIEGRDVVAWTQIARPDEHVVDDIWVQPGMVVAVFTRLNRSWRGCAAC